MTALLKDDTELFKQFSDNESFRRWLTNHDLFRKGVVFAKFMCATLSTLRTGCMAQSGRGAGAVAASEVAVGDVNPTWRGYEMLCPRTL